MDKIETYIAKHTKWTDELSLLRKILLEANLEESIKWGAPVYMFENKNIIGIGAFKNHCALWFFKGAMLEDPKNLLFNAQKDKTKLLRQYRISTDSDINIPYLKKLIQSAIHIEKSGVIIPKAPPKKVSIPDLLLDKMDEDLELRTAFSQFTPSKQREFCEYIEQAKRMNTKISRLQKIILLIKSGKSLYQKYM